MGTMGTYGAWFVVLLLGCAGCASPQTVARRPPVYNYKEAQAAKVDVTIGIVKSTKPANFAPGDCGADFADNFDKTLYEMMLAKGMNTKGPFGSRDEMTFPDKKGSDLLVAPQLELKIAFTETGSSAHMNSVSITYDIVFGGALVLTAIEPLSAEKMWFKRIELPTTTKKVEIQSAGGGKDAASVANQLNNACDATLMDFYNKSMPEVSRYFSADEMLNLKKQSQELREKKAY